LADLESELEKRANQIAQELSSAEWLYVLRRVSWLFEGRGPLSSGYLMTSAESISARSRKSPRPFEVVPPWVTYTVDDATVASIHRLGAATLHLGNLQNLLRCAGNGSTVKARDGGIPLPVPDLELDRMTTLWDRRMADSSFDFLARAGLYSHKLHSLPEPADQSDLVPIAIRSNARFGLSPLPLGALPTLSDNKLPVEMRFPRAVLDLLVFLISASLYRLVNSEDTKGQAEEFERSGFQILRRELALGEVEIALDLLKTHRLGRCIPDEVDFGSPNEILDRLASPDVSAWPPSMGPAIREAADGLLVEDLWAATLRLERALARPAEMAGGQYANAWSEHFETVIQQAVDASAWKPSQDIAALRRRHLAVDGKRIAEIDAIGEQAGRLLLVSCKCIPFSEAWNKGEFGAVRNVATAVDEAVSVWADRMTKLRSNLHGDNYDFSRFAEITGVVVLPSLPWTSTASSTAEVSLGLRAAVSANELDRWMNGAV
jgi:hypothetical protein